MESETSDHQAEPGAAMALFALLNGPIIWSIHFAGIYLMQSMTCTLAGNLPAANQRAIIVTAVAIATIAAISAMSYVTFVRDNWKGAPEVTARLLQRVTTLLYLLSGFAIIAAAFTVLPMPPCAELR